MAGRPPRHKAPPTTMFCKEVVDFSTKTCLCLTYLNVVLKSPASAYFVNSMPRFCKNMQSYANMDSFECRLVPNVF